MSDPLQGYDVTISIIGENGPELVGQYQEAEITVTNELQEYLETGERIPRQLDGQIGIEGKLTRGCCMLMLFSALWVAVLSAGVKLSRKARVLPLKLHLKTATKAMTVESVLNRLCLTNWHCLLRQAQK